MGTETVTSGYADPCGPITDDSGEGVDTGSSPCTKVDPGLWIRGTATETDAYILQRDGVTISLISFGFGPSDGLSKGLAPSPFVLRDAILAAHPASDAELWPLVAPSPDTFWGMFVL